MGYVKLIDYSKVVDNLWLYYIFYSNYAYSSIINSSSRCIALLPISEGTEAGDSRMKRIALVTSMVNFFVSIVLWGEFDSSASQYQFVQEFNNLSFCHFHIGIDGISLYFVLLTTFITPICILSNWSNIKNGIKYF